MARKVQIVTIHDPAVAAKPAVDAVVDDAGNIVDPGSPAVAAKEQGRDHGKVFQITEMPASKAEAWALRAFLALAAGNQDIPELDRIRTLGMAGIAILGFKALSGLDYDKAKPLFDEMFDCVRIVPDPSKPEVVRKLVEDDIEDVATRMKLRMEVFSLHTGFSLAGVRS